MPFDHVVVLMMENHSFDNLLGDLGRTRTDVDGLTFDDTGRATNSNPAPGSGSSAVRSYPKTGTAQTKNVTQSWRATHEQINHGKMDGFVSSEHGQTEAMGYYPPAVLPFAYSLAGTYTLANRWFSSVPGPTYPNRRFFLAGTAFGGTTSAPTEILKAFEKPPPNGTIFDRLSQHGISWANYSTDIPMTTVLPRVLLRYPHNHHRVKRFREDCEAGKLPAVSFVDPAMGFLSAIANALEQIPREIKDALDRLDPSETQEDPGDMYYGEKWAHGIIEAVVRSPAWPRTLLIYTYDEHGGYYDHVPPPPAIAPDQIPPQLGPGESGDYGMYGPRVPAIVVSPYSKPGGVSNLVYDHTSVLATIEHKWNLPALTNRDANAATVMDFLDTSQMPRLHPPRLTAPSDTGPSGPEQGGTAMPIKLKGAKIAPDPVARYAELVGLSAPPAQPLQSDTLVALTAGGGDEITALSRHVAEHSKLTLAQAQPAVKAALQKSAEEGETDAQAKAKVVNEVTTKFAGASANLQLSEPVMLEPIFRVGFAGIMVVISAVCVLFVRVIGTKSSTQESAVIGLTVLGVLALVAVLVLVMGYKNVKISGGPSAGGAP